MFPPYYYQGDRLTSDSLSNMQINRFFKHLCNPPEDHTFALKSLAIETGGFWKVGEPELHSIREVLVAYSCGCYPALEHLRLRFLAGEPKNTEFVMEAHEILGGEMIECELD